MAPRKQKTYWTPRGAEKKRRYGWGEDDTKPDAVPYVYRVEYSVIKNLMLDRIKNGKWDYTQVPPRINGSVEFDTFMGATEKQAEIWLRKGYDIKRAREYVHADTYAAPRRRLRWTDDGDIDVGAALSGSDYPFTKWDPRPKKPGLAIVADIAFNANVPGEVLADYGNWLIAEVKRFEERGYDIDLTLAIPLRTLFNGATTPYKTDILISLKRENEASDSRSWGPMFSPMGFRGLGFIAIHQCATYHDWQLTSGLGSAYAGRDWTVLFNQNTRIMRIGVPSSGGSNFDPERMTDLMQSALPEG